MTSSKEWNQDNLNNLQANSHYAKYANIFAHTKPTFSAAAALISKFVLTLSEYFDRFSPNVMNFPQTLS